MQNTAFCASESGWKLLHKKTLTVLRCRAVDPDPAPAFQVNPDPDTDLIQDFDDQKLKKKNIQMKNLLDQKL
jgi:hypothetical protein